MVDGCGAILVNRHGHLFVPARVRPASLRRAVTGEEPSDRIARADGTNGEPDGAAANLTDSLRTRLAAWLVGDAPVLEEMPVLFRAFCKRLLRARPEAAVAASRALPLGSGDRVPEPETAGPHSGGHFSERTS